jgi:hypothetical protein
MTTQQTLTEEQALLLLNRLAEADLTENTEAEEISDDEVDLQYDRLRSAIFDDLSESRPVPRAPVLTLVTDNTARQAPAAAAVFRFPPRPRALRELELAAAPGLEGNLDHDGIRPGSVTMTWISPERLRVLFTFPLSYAGGVLQVQAMPGERDLGPVHLGGKFGYATGALELDSTRLDGTDAIAVTPPTPPQDA